MRHVSIYDYIGAVDVRIRSGRLIPYNAPYVLNKESKGDEARTTNKTPHIPHEVKAASWGWIQVGNERAIFHGIALK